VGIKQVKVDVNELSLGMYVSGLDRPWSQTPFPLQGFYLRDLQEINQLKSLCNYVYIDVERGRGPIAANLKRLDTKLGKTKMVGREPDHAVLNEPIAPLKIQRNLYREIQPLQKEVKKAKQLHQKVYGAVVEVIQMLENKQLENISLGETKKVASEMVDSVSRCFHMVVTRSRKRRIYLQPCGALIGVGDSVWPSYWFTQTRSRCARIRCATERCGKGYARPSRIG
jgi:hypothetical protein